MSTEFVMADVLPGKLNALVKNIMSQTGETDPDEAVRLVNSGEWVVSKPTLRWRVDADGLIHFSLTSTGETGAEWADWFKVNKYDLGSEAEFVLRSSSFQPSPAGPGYEIAVMPGRLWKKDSERTTANIRAEADRRHLKHGKDMPAEIVCLIRRASSDKEIEAMGLGWIIGLHEPISGSDGCPVLLGAHRRCGDRGLDAYDDRPVDLWYSAGGFASVVSQVSPQVLES